MKILAIETSCDETACAVVENGTNVLSNAVASSAAMHEKYGGIVPEVAAREQLRSIIPVITEALLPLDGYYKSIDSFIVAKQKRRKERILPVRSLISNHIDAIAVTIGPGLIGSLLVGVETAKTIAYVTGKPIIPVNHVIAHVYANFVRNKQQTAENQQQKNNVTPNNASLLSRSTSAHRKSAPTGLAIEFPAISLVVSGGHTELYLMNSMKELRWLGGTLDDAAGEAFDKTARLLGFGSRGGVAIQEASTKIKNPFDKTQGKQNSKIKIKFPRPMLNDQSLNFSFSGLKTAVVREWKKYPRPSSTTINAFAHEIQEAITDVLVEKTLRAANQFGAKSVLLSGGVAANIRLREKFRARGSGFMMFAPEPQRCTDNAVFIAACAYFLGKPTDWKKMAAAPSLSVEGEFP